MRNYLITAIIATVFLTIIGVKAFRTLGQFVESENAKSVAAWNQAMGK